MFFNFLQITIELLIEVIIVIILFCCFIVDNGDVFVWGYGILGKGPNFEQSELPTQLPPSLFGVSEFSPDVKVVDIKCGINFFAALTSKFLL